MHSEDPLRNGVRKHEAKDSLRVVETDKHYSVIVRKLEEAVKRNGLTYSRHLLMTMQLASRLS
jgi:hypothetical protein